MPRYRPNDLVVKSKGPVEMEDYDEIYCASVETKNGAIIVAIFTTEKSVADQISQNLGLALEKSEFVLVP